MFEVSQFPLLQSRRVPKEELACRRVAAIAFNVVIGDPIPQLQKTLTHCLCVDDVIRHQGSGMRSIGETWTAFEINRQSFVVDVTMQVSGSTFCFGITYFER